MTAQEHGPTRSATAQDLPQGTRQVRLVVVHGIGSQSAGRTVQSWAEALVRFATAAGHGSSVLTARLTGDAPEVRLEVRPALDDPDDDAPPTSRIQVVEAYWADAFPQPTLGRVLRFLFTVAPTLAITQTLLILAPTRRTARGWAAATARAGATLAPIALVLLALAVAAPVVAAVLLVLLLAVSVPVPAVRTAVGKALGWLTTSIGDAYLFVADPVSRSAMVTRLESLLRPQADGTTPPAERGTTVVLAHSQGAAVAYQALHRLEESERPAALVTLGSGLGRLTDLDALRGLPWALTPLYGFIAFATLVAVPLWDGPLVRGVPLGRPVVALALVALVLVWRLCAGLPAVTGRETSGPVSWPAWSAWALAAAAVSLGEVGWSALLAALGACAAVVRARRHPRVRPHGQGAAAGPGIQALPGTRWLDVWALLDPVPNGRGLPDDEHYQQQVVPGELSVLRDHVRYAHDRGQTIPLVFRRLLDPSGTGRIAVDGVRGDRARLGPLAVRDVVGLLLRTVPLAATAIAAVQVDVTALGLWLRTALPTWTQTPLDTVLSPVGAVGRSLEPWWPGAPSVWEVLGAAALAGLGLGGSVAVRRTLSGFQSWETRDWLASKPFASSAPAVPRAGRARTGRWSRLRWTAVLAVVALVAGLVPGVLVWQRDHRDGAWTAGQVARAYVTALAEDDLHAACAVTSPGVAGAQAGFPCDARGAPSERSLCAEVREALAALERDAITVRDGAVRLDWAPEEPPSCDSASSAAVLLPVRVERPTRGGRLQVTEVAEES